jgi:CRISPR/Cas system CMR subunit Cmr6 (Cas7 group RAMP superfamily)
MAEILAHQFAEKAGPSGSLIEIKAIKREIVDKAVDAKPVWSGDLHQRGSRLQKILSDENVNRAGEAAGMPSLCFRLKIEARLVTPLVMKGDRPFVAHGNPFNIEKTTGRPMIRPSSLKGQFRQALLTVSRGNQVKLLCGDANDEDGTGRKGRVEFLPCYVDKAISHDVIAPHDEKIRRINPGPVTIEVVEPPLTLSIWMQYWPHDLLSRWARREVINNQDLIFDFIYTAAGFYFWLCRAGIGAKTSSGYGQVAHDDAKLYLFAAPGSPWGKLVPGNGEPIKDLVTKKRQNSLVKGFSQKWLDFQKSSHSTGAPGGHHE